MFRGRSSTTSCGSSFVGLVAVIAAASVSATGCGYRAVYSSAASERLHVAVVNSWIADSVATAEVVAGVRDGLIREGAFAQGTDYPRVEIEVLRTDELSEGIVSSAGGVPLASAPQTPRARGIDIGLVVRGWIKRSAEATPERDTGDLRSFSLISVDATSGALDPTMGMLRAEDARRSTARRLGLRLALALLGYAAISEESDDQER